MLSLDAEQICRMRQKKKNMSPFVFGWEISQHPLRVDVAGIQVSWDTHQIMSENVSVAPRGHSRTLFPLITELNPPLGLLWSPPPPLRKCTKRKLWFSLFCPFFMLLLKSICLHQVSDLWYYGLYSTSIIIGCRKQPLNNPFFKLSSVKNLKGRKKTDCFHV